MLYRRVLGESKCQFFQIFIVNFRYLQSCKLHYAVHVFIHYYSGDLITFFWPSTFYLNSQMALKF